MESPKVWIVSGNRHDYSEAKIFGDLRMLFSGTVSLYNIDAIEEEIDRRLDRESSIDDHVIFSGHSILTFLVGSYFYRRYGHVKILVWVDSRKAYRPLTLVNRPSRTPESMAKHDV